MIPVSLSGVFLINSLYFKFDNDSINTGLPYNKLNEKNENLGKIKYLNINI